jgi:hypothetical protein
MSRRRRRTRSPQAVDSDELMGSTEEPENAHIPDEEIDAEDAANQARIAEEDQALAEVEAEHGVESTPAIDDDGQTWPEGSPERRAIEAGIGRFPADEEGPGDGHPEPIDQPAYEIGDDEWPYPDGAGPPFDPEIFERGPLAAGIRMLEALLTEARAGYITAQLDELERAIEETFSPPERQFLGKVAADISTASGLPDVAGAYKHLVRARVQAGA